MNFPYLWLELLLPLVAALDFNYHHQEGMEAFLKTVAQNYSSITHLHSIGKSVKGRVRLCTLSQTLSTPFQYSLSMPQLPVCSSMHLL